jgi:hypothetical protein
MATHLTNYEPRSWSTYEISLDECSTIPTRPITGEFQEMLAESHSAAALGDRTDYDPAKVFFVDFEQSAAGHNVHPCGMLMRLTEEFRGHAVDKLAFVSHEGLDKEEPTYMFWVED